MPVRAENVVTSLLFPRLLALVPGQLHLRADAFCRMRFPRSSGHNAYCCKTLDTTLHEKTLRSRYLDAFLL